MMIGMKYLLSVPLFLIPAVTFAAAGDGSLQGLISGIGGFINEVLIPFTLGVAFLIFIINAVRFFVIGGDNTESQENAKSLALYGVGAFVLILSLWGLVNLLSNGFGLNEGPCVGGQAVQSDYLYGIDSNAPCSSPRPQPRAHPTIDPVAPGGGFGSGVPNTDTSPTIPGNAPGPTTMPGLPTPPAGETSFTPDGLPMSYAAVQTAQAAIKKPAATYFSGPINNDFGYNKDIVMPLFADLNKTTNDPISEIERLKAAVRLGEIGAIPVSVVNTYIAAYNTYSTAAGTASDKPVTLTTLKTTTAALLPATLISRRNQTKQLVIDTLVANNIKNNTTVNVDQVVTKLYNPNTTPESRYKAVVELYNPSANNTQAKLSMNVQSQALLFDRLLADINTEKIYTGDFTLGF